MGLNYPKYIGSGKAVMMIHSGGDNNQKPILLAIVVGDSCDDCKRRWIESRGGDANYFEDEFEFEMANWKSASFYVDTNEDSDGSKTNG